MTSHNTPHPRLWVDTTPKWLDETGLKGSSPTLMGTNCNGGPIVAKGWRSPAPPRRVQGAAAAPTPNGTTLEAPVVDEGRDGGGSGV